MTESFAAIAVYYCPKTLHLRCFLGSWLGPCLWKLNLYCSEFRYLMWYLIWYLIFFWFVFSQLRNKYEYLPIIGHKSQFSFWTRKTHSRKNSVLRHLLGFILFLDSERHKVLVRRSSCLQNIFWSKIIGVCRFLLRCSFLIFPLAWFLTYKLRKQPLKGVIYKMNVLKIFENSQGTTYNVVFLLSIVVCCRSETLL